MKLVVFCKENGEPNMLSICRPKEKNGVQTDFLSHPPKISRLKMYKSQALDIEGCEAAINSILHVAMGQKRVLYLKNLIGKRTNRLKPVVPAWVFFLTHSQHVIY